MYATGLNMACAATPARSNTSRQSAASGICSSQKRMESRCTALCARCNGARTLQQQSSARAVHCVVSQVTAAAPVESAIVWQQLQQQRQHTVCRATRKDSLLPSLPVLVCQPLAAPFQSLLPRPAPEPLQRRRSGSAAAHCRRARPAGYSCLSHCWCCRQQLHAGRLRRPCCQHQRRDALPQHQHRCCRTVPAQPHVYVHCRGAAALRRRSPGCSRLPGIRGPTLAPAAPAAGGSCRGGGGARRWHAPPQHCASVKSRPDTGKGMHGQPASQRKAKRAGIHPQRAAAAPDVQRAVLLTVQAGVVDRHDAGPG